MKPTRLGMMLLAAVMLCMAGCTKPDDGGQTSNPNENNGGYTPGGGGNNGGGNGTNNIGIYNGHEYIDLGLPSGTLWATCNVGAYSPESYGDYFAWGETNAKSFYDLDNNYKHGKVIIDGYWLTKYNTDSNNGTVDNLTSLQASDDAATANWGDGWHTPTNAQWDELYRNTTASWTNQNGVNGLLLTTSKGSLFIPAAGYYVLGDAYATNKGCVYWTNQLDTSETLLAWHLKYYSQSGYKLASLSRGDGMPVRPVH